MLAQWKQMQKLNGVRSGIQFKITKSKNNNKNYKETIIS